jgi:uncharacterized protein (TIGR02996 family)
MAKAKPEPKKPLPDISAFSRTINDNHADITPRLVFADFLDENGHPHHAAALRMDAAGKKTAESGDLIRELGINPHPTPVKSIAVRGRRWFQRTNGNTYHTADIFVNGEHVHTTPTTYGYGSAYQDTAKQWLHQSGYLSHTPEGYSSLWRSSQDHGIDYQDSVDDVKRKADL